ncbi:hypothetical protein [Synechococcus sp. BIOS-E4-1]|uniref:hypothetical protein n=1 Tax=Synechococcus sp. BIOS-E4-1 TaxID=1400864 RepID=UPI001645EC00|nr:hypothetical protein [Synechococcus sp. BIOS-E4-1]
MSTAQREWDGLPEGHSSLDSDPDSLAKGMKSGKTVLISELQDDEITSSDVPTAPRCPLLIPEMSKLISMMTSILVLISRKRK